VENHHAGLRKQTKSNGQIKNEKKERKNLTGTFGAGFSEGLMIFHTMNKGTRPRSRERVDTVGQEVRSRS